MGAEQTDRGNIASRESTAKLDHVSFAALYRSAYPRLSLIAIGIIGDRTHAEDIVQDAAVIALRKLEEFSPGTCFGAWMAAIVRRCALNYARKTRNRATFAMDPTSLDHSNRTATRPNSEETINSVGALVENQSDFDDEVVRALRTLSEETRCCLLPRTVLDLSYAEISALLEMPQGTCMSHVHRGKATMRRMLMKKGRLDSEQHK